jgi:hypothetical protein
MWEYLMLRFIGCLCVGLISAWIVNKRIHVRDAPSIHFMFSMAFAFVGYIIVRCLIDLMFILEIIKESLL